MSSFEEKVLDNPLNPTSGDGRVRNRTKGAKGVLLLFVLLGAMAIAIPTLYAFLVFRLGSGTLSGLIIFLVYAPITLKLTSLTVLEEKKNKIAFIDQLDNEVSTLSTFWEIQDIKPMEIGGGEIGYIDYINGTRTMVVKIVAGSTLNRTDSEKLNHFDVLESFLNSIDDSGFYKDVYMMDESVNDDEALRYYYDNASESGDEKYIKTFTRMLDFTKYIVDVRGSTTSLYIIINGWGPNKHLMRERIPMMVPILEGSRLIYEYYILNEIEVNQLIAEDSSVASFDINDIKMNKYKNTSKLGNTAVIEVRDKEGNVTAQYNPAYDARRKTSIRSFGLSTEDSKKKKVKEELTPAQKLKMIEDNRKRVKTRETNNGVKFDTNDGEEMKVTKVANNDLFIRLVDESDDIEEIKLGKGKMK